MKKRYSISVIGAGDRGNCYMGMISEYYDGEIEWSTICDILPDRLEKACTTYGFKYKTDKWETAIKEHTPDIVIIAAPAYHHCDIAIFAMRCGCHVLTEKPLDLSLAKCFALEECQQQTGKVLAIGMQYRNMEKYRSLKHVFEKGLLGTNLMMFFSDIRETRPKIAMHDAKYGNGGPMVDMACHIFDIMRWFFNSDPVKVSCQWRKNSIDRPSLSSIENIAADACIMIVEYENGSVGNIMLNWGLPDKIFDAQYCVITGSDGLIAAHDLWSSKTAQVITSGGIVVSVGTIPEDADDLINSERTVFAHFIAEIEDTGKAQCSIHDGILALATSMAALKSGAEGRPVSLCEIIDTRPTVLDSMEEPADL
jgi:predicted dehydrogenase